jgi:hypothetical protein
MPSSGMWRRVDLVWTDVSELQPPAHAGSYLANYSTLKMEAVGSSDTSAHTGSTRSHIPDDGILPLKRLHMDVGLCFSDKISGYQFLGNVYLVLRDHTVKAYMRCKGKIRALWTPTLDRAEFPELLKWYDGSSGSNFPWAINETSNEKNNYYVQKYIRTWATSEHSHRWKWGTCRIGE